MDLNKKIASSIKLNGHKETVTHTPKEQRAPTSEIEDQITKVLGVDSHYPDVFSAIGKLVSDGHHWDTLRLNAPFISKYIVEGSTTDLMAAIDSHQKSPKYSNQLGQSKFPPAGDCFSEEVYQNLPEPIASIVALVPDQRSKDVCLMGIILALSAAFSRYRFYHGGNGDVKEYSPHLIGLVLGSAGSGKSQIRHGNTIVDMITRRALQLQEMARREYLDQLSDYNAEKKKRLKDGISLRGLYPPQPALRITFGMSASDTTQPALVGVLKDNPAGGFAHDSELDTLTQGTSNKEFGGFSDIIRKVFHHEPLSRQRKMENESYTVENPRLAISLSGTHDQLKKLITSEYNGLFSRVWYYCIPKKFQAYAIATTDKDVIMAACIKRQEEVFKRADLWGRQHIYLEFSAEQERELFDAMQDKREVEERYGGDIGASWLRMALMVKRIAVTLAAMEDAKTSIPDNCWKCAILLLPAMKSHVIQALQIVRGNNGLKKVDQEDYLMLKDDGKTDKEAAKTLGISIRTLASRIKEWKQGE